MKFATLALLGAVSAYETMTDVDYAFIEFVAKHGKSYGTKEEFQMRLSQFAQFKKEVDHLNSLGMTSVHEVNKFADLTDAERKKFLTGFIPSTGSKNYTKFPQANDDSVDWRLKGAVTAVKDQGQCGSCWSFSTTGTVEGSEFLAGRGLTSLSEQQLVSCNVPSSLGCAGGNMRTALDYCATDQLMTEADWPYTAKSNFKECSAKYDKTKTVTNVTGHDEIEPTEAALRSAIAIGPVSIAIEADKLVFQSYKTGILDTPKCGTTLDHGVLAVGYGTLAGKNFAIVKNSWGGDWGDKGYISIATADDTCGLELEA